MSSNKPLSETDGIFARAYASALKDRFQVDVGDRYAIYTSPANLRGIAAGDLIYPQITNYQIYKFADSLQYSDNPSYIGGTAGSDLQQLDSYITWARSESDPSPEIADRMSKAREAVEAATTNYSVVLLQAQNQWIKVQKLYPNDDFWRWIAQGNYPLLDVADRTRKATQSEAYLAMQAREGIQIGDLGFINNSGGFEYLFNICHSADHDMNAGRVPEEFKPLLDIDPDDVADDAIEYEPGSHVASNPHRIHKRKIESKQPQLQFDIFFVCDETGIHVVFFFRNVPDEVGAGLSFSSSAKQGALLILPEGGKRVDHRQHSKFRNYAIEFAQSWYQHVNGPLAREIQNGSLYLVTGYDKARAWGVACFDDEDTDSGGISLDFVPKSSSAAGLKAPKYWFTQCRGASTLSDSDDLFENRSGAVFLRGFKIAIRDSWIFPKSSEVTYISSLNTDSLLPKPQTQLAPGSLISWRWLRLSLSTSVHDRGPEDHEAIITSIPLTHRMCHPSDIINRWKLKSVTSALTLQLLLPMTTIGPPSFFLYAFIAWLKLVSMSSFAYYIFEGDEKMPDDEELITRMIILELQQTQSASEDKTPASKIPYTVTSNLLYSKEQLPIFKASPLEERPSVPHLPSLQSDAEVHHDRQMLPEPFQWNMLTVNTYMTLQTNEMPIYVQRKEIKLGIITLEQKEDGYKLQSSQHWPVSASQASSQGDSTSSFEHPSSSDRHAGPAPGALNTIVTSSSTPSLSSAVTPVYSCLECRARYASRSSVLGWLNYHDRHQ
ncbi:hypothetical protein D9757_013195 [Collybiopsis confluens]|uniref:Uncharacterized protein n=1 Tax=Collybiopsis confluens TaxID=2823264 RepID=A0A8H5CZM2_9AGAR|nr:hypothetical protein D9757_013195 [Collybiopsis confluens]